MSAHTPVPWVLGNDNNLCCDVDCGNGRTRISLDRMDALGLAEYAITREEMLANARLVAAAPELLEALVTLVAEEAPAIDQPEWKRARAAIAKARGGR